MTVSVVIPCFELGAFLPEAVASVRAQTLAPLEIVVVDDGSTDAETVRVLTDLEAEGDVVVLHTENRGAPAARNHGIEHARGEYILCLDADDVLIREFLAATVPVLDARPDVGVVATHVELFGEATGVWEVSEFDPVALLRDNCIGSASLFRRACWREVGGWADLPAFQDWDLWISIVERGWKWAVVPRVLYCYRVRPGSLSVSGEARRPELLRELIRRHADTYGKNWVDVLAAGDAEVRNLRAELRAAERAAETRDAQVLALRESLGERPARSDGLRVLVDAVVPPEARVVVATRGDDELLHLGEHDGWHLPRDANSDHPGSQAANSAEAIAHLEAVRREGAEFLALPAAALDWLDRHDGFRRHVEQRYRVVSRHPASGLVVDVRAEAERRGFSMVVCTHDRPRLLRRAIESVLAQEYPADRYELLVVDNGPTDAARRIVEDAAARTAVRVTYLVETTNGLSHARNFGVARARHEYVAFLDDDAIAPPDWLSAFNAVVNEHGALVVGGPIVPVVEPGVERPAWFEERYVKGFFGLDFRDWGKTGRIVPVRHPLYLGGGNSAYAKRLFARFGGFRPDLGRNARSLLAAEETALNAELELAGVPIYYTADAPVEHVIERDRITRRHVARKAFWAGVSDARAADRGEAARRRREIAAELGREALAALRTRGPGRFGRACRAAYAVGFLTASWRDSGHARPGEPPALTEWLPSEAAEPAARPRSYAAVPRSEYEALVGRVRASAERNLPAGAQVLVAAKGDDALLELGDRKASHFPADARGRYAGHYPGDSQEAVAQLEALRRAGSRYLVFPATSFWWLEHYRGLARHLECTGRVVSSDHDCLIYELGEPARSTPTPREGLAA